MNNEGLRIFATASAEREAALAAVIARALASLDTDGPLYGVELRRILTSAPETVLAEYRRQAQEEAWDMCVSERQVNIYLPNPYRALTEKGAAE